jgi:hypothetical protein
MRINQVLDKLTGRKTFTSEEKTDIQNYIAEVGRMYKNEAKGTDISSKLIEEQIEREKQDIKKWREAIGEAEDPENPDPLNLYMIYLDVMDDDQVFSTVQQRTSKAISGRINIKDENNEIDEEATALLMKPDGTPKQWLRDFLKISMLSKFYGYSVAQFYPPVDGKFIFDLETGQDPVKLIPPEHMVPRLRSLRISTQDGVDEEKNLIALFGGPGSEWVIASGKEDDLGLLNKVTPFWIWKKVFSAWAQHANIFGMPFRKGKTDVYDPKRLQNMVNMFESMTGATYFIGHPDDDVEISYQVNSGSAGGLYDKLIEKCDQAIAKIILSQTGTTDEKSFAGSAEVHAGVMGDITWSDKLDLAAVVDSRLIPFLKQIGMLPEGAEVFASWELDDEVSLTEWATIIKELAVIFDMDPDEIGKKFNLSLEAKEAVGTPGKEETPEQKQNREELQNVYKKYFR